MNRLLENGDSICRMITSKSKDQKKFKTEDGFWDWLKKMAEQAAAI